MSTPAVSDKNTPYFQATVPGVSQVVDFTGTAGYCVQSFATGTTIIECFATQDCWVRLVESTSSDVAAVISAGAAGDSVFCPGGIVRFIGVPFKRDVRYKLSVVKNSTNGTLYISEAV